MKRILFVLALLTGINSFGQGILSRSISLEVTRQRLDNVLEILSNKGDFYFSYSSRVVKKDSLVTLDVHNKTVREILNLLFNTTYEFKESGNYVIIRKAPIRMTIVTSKAVMQERIYSVSGHVYDEQTGAAIHEASVYEKKMLASAITDMGGYFRLKLKSSKASTATLTVSKEFYEDTFIVIEPRHSQELTITMLPVEREHERVIISPEDYLVPDSARKVIPDSTVNVQLVSALDSAKVERTRMGKFLLSTRQKIQSINLRRFFTTRPFQVSFIPGLGSHGKMSGQVVNNFSLNVLGGYTAGTHGVELGGLFNIDKKDVKYVQAAGLFNVVGGQVKGFQVAGVNNTVLDTVYAFQAAGVNNLVKGKFTGVQMAGVYNHVTDSVKGAQFSGVGNFAKKKVSGLQVAGVMNFSNKEMDGVQIAGVINYTKKLKGVQLGLINIADTSEGYSIGLINIILKGYHKLSISSNEVLDVNLSFKTGNRKLYSILQAGLRSGETDKIYAFGYGLGSELPVNKRGNLLVNPELVSQYLYLGTWDHHNVLNRFQFNFMLKINRYISVYAGPAYSVFLSDQKTGVAGYRFPIPSSSYHVNSFSSRFTGWFGWNAGINFF